MVMAKPADFYLGVSEFFSVLVPGFVVTVSMLEYANTIDYADMGSNLWIAVLVVSYILGHVLFAIGACWDELYDRIKPHGNEGLLYAVGTIRNAADIKDCSCINNYQWSRAVLSSRHVEGYNEVLRKEADSKLFRSLIIPLLIAAWILFDSDEFSGSMMALVLAGISFWRYRGQRFKACKIAYRHVVVQNQLLHIDLGR